MIIAAVIAAGAIGALLRHLLSRRLGGTENPFPWAVLVVNVTGSAIGGLVLGLATAGAVSSEVQLILLTGFCGGLTTFSTFSVETIQLILDGKARSAVTSVVLNLVLGIGVAALTFTLTA